MTFSDKTALRIMRSEPGWRKDGFMRFIRRAIKMTEGDGEDEGFTIDAIGGKFVPDLWRVVYKPWAGDWESCRNEWWGWKIQIIEIEDTSLLTETKMELIQNFWFAIDSTSLWHFELFVCDRYGHNRRQIDVGSYWWDDMWRKHSPENKMNSLNA